MPVGRWYTDGSFHGPFPLMASSMELEKDRSFDALASDRGAEDQGGIRVGRSVTSGRRAIRTRSTRRWPRGAASCSTRRTSAATGAMGPTTAGATCSGRASTWTSAPIARRLDVVSTGFIAAFDASPLAAEGVAGAEPGLRRDAADRRLGEFSVSPQRQRADAASSAGSGRRSGRSCSRFCAARTAGSRAGGAAALCRPARRVADPARTGSSGSATTATGSTPRALDVPTRATISGRHIRTDANRRALIEYLKTL